MLLWHDFGDHKEGFAKSVVGFVMRYFEGLGVTMTYKEAISRIMEDIPNFEVKAGILAELNLIRVKGSKPSNKGIVIKNKFEDYDIAFWEGLSVEGLSRIDKDLLKRFETFPISEAYMEGRLWRKASAFDPMFAYIFNFGKDDYSFQLYRPLSETKSGRFRNHNTDGQIFGLDQLPRRGKTLIITKSGKDVLVLVSMGFSAIAPIGEASYTFLIKLLPELLSRFDHIFIMYDPDDTGNYYSDLVCSKFEGVLTKIIIPDEFEKDPSDNVIAGKGKDFYNFLIKQTSDDGLG